MKARPLHDWNVAPAEARDIQQRLRRRVRLTPYHGPLRRVAGVDVGIKHNRATAAVVVLDANTLEVIEVAAAARPVEFPYIPGLLSFREVPVILEAAEKLTADPDVVLLDGQGIAHPRRFGLACHLGVLWNKPAIGCAKSRFIGVHEEPHEAAGSYTDLFDDRQDPPELIGAVLRSRDDVRPLYISAGHRVELPQAIDLVLDCCAGYRLPEPTRLAHHAAAGNLRQT
ncbi:MAG: deoxyribonuclease V [Planctomycetota bacterium]